MKQVVQHLRTGVLRVEEVPSASTLDGRLLVATRASLISAGTERSTVQVAQQNLLDKARSRPDLVRKVLDSARREGIMRTVDAVLDRLDKPAALGYSSAGVVLEVGRGLSGFQAGDRVACAGQNYASHAEVVSVPAPLCATIPEGVEFEDAAFVTLGAIALQGVRQADVRLGEIVAVVGLGLLGQLTVQLLKASGCRVVGADLDAGKVDLALHLGAEAAGFPDALPEIVARMTQDHGVDAVIVTAGTKSDGPVELAGTIARKKGRVVVVGAVGLTIPREPYYKKELELRMSMSYGPGRYDPAYEEGGRDYPYAYVRWTEQRNMQAFLSLLGSGQASVKPLITHRFPIDEAGAAYEALADPQGGALGIVLQYPAQDSVVRRRIEPAAIARHSRPVEGLQFGIIGAGQHVRDRLLPALDATNRAGIRAICSATGLQAKAIAEKWKAEYATTDYRELLADPGITAVVIGTRHHLHAELVIASLRAGKHVFVEKPLCLTADELDRIGEAYRAAAPTGLHLMVGFNRRFSAHALKAREFVRQPRGPLMLQYRVNAGWLPPDHWVHDPLVGGGRLLGEACHFVDYCQFLCGAPPASVFARRVTAGPTDDQFMLSIGFCDGSLATLTYTSGGDSALPKERVEILGNGRALLMDDFVETRFWARGSESAFRTRRQDKGFEEEMTALGKVLTHGGEAPISWPELEASTRACFAAERSLSTGLPEAVDGVA